MNRSLLEDFNLECLVEENSFALQREWKGTFENKFSDTHSNLYHAIKYLNSIRKWYHYIPFTYIEEDGYLFKISNNGYYIYYIKIYIIVNGRTEKVFEGSTNSINYQTKVDYIVPGKWLYKLDSIIDKGYNIALGERKEREKKRIHETKTFNRSVA